MDLDTGAVLGVTVQGADEGDAQSMGAARRRQARGDPKMEHGKTYDVLVVGGGVAGVAAALEAARSGRSTALVEKTILWGGLATSGLVPIYMPLCDGHSRQVTFGIAEELLKRSIQYGPGDVPMGWGKERREKRGEEREVLYPDGHLERRYMTWFSPAAFVFALDEALDASGADLWLDTLACKPVVEGRRVSGVEVENKSGRIMVKGRCVIDASGDADIACRAGAPCDENRHHPTLLYQYTSLARAREAVREESAAKLVTHRGIGASEMGKGYSGPLRKCAATKGKDVSAFVMESRRIARNQIAAEQGQGGETSRKNCYPVTVPTMAQFRMTRTIVGQETVREDGRNRPCDSSVGLIADNRQSGAVWAVPYGSLLPREVEGLLAAGRCVAAQGYAWQVTRLIPAAALTGQLAAIAAVLAVQHETTPDKLDVKDVQEAVGKRGILWCL